MLVQIRAKVRAETERVRVLGRCLTMTSGARARADTTMMMMAVAKQEIQSFPEDVGGAQNTRPHS